MRKIKNKALKQSFDEVFDDKFIEDKDFKRACRDADAEIQTNCGFGLPTNNSNVNIHIENETADDLRKKWELGEKSQPAFSEHLDDAMLKLEEKLKMLANDI